jgi:hypothetical protein
MPRSVNPAHARRWAELAIQGSTVAEIRKAHHERTGKTVDPRTIERALEKTKAEIAESAASAAELQHGIREHSKQLMASIDPLTKAIRSTVSGKLNPLPMYATTADHIAVGVSRADSTGGSWKVSIPREDSIELRLLKEHLPNDKSWKMLEKFSDSAVGWIEARLIFAAQIKLELQTLPESLGVSTVVAEPFDMAGLAAIESTAVSARIEDGRDIDDLLSTLTIDSTRGVANLGSVSVTSFRPTSLDKLRVSISERVGVVTSSKIGQDTLTSWASFARAGTNLLDELAILKLVTYLPGTCSSCKRFRLG